MKYKNSTAMDSIYEIRLTFEALSIYRQILSDQVTLRLYALVDYIYRGDCDLCGFINRYNNFYNILIKNQSTGSLTDYIIEYIISDENVFSGKAEFTKLQNMEDSIINACKVDLSYLKRISEITSGLFKSIASEHLCSMEIEAEMVRKLPEWNSFVSKGFSEIKDKITACSQWEDCIEFLAEFYRKNGTGIFTRHRGFIWEADGGTKHIQGITSPDPIRLNDLIGYETERGEVIDNTVKFLKGYTANNMLLYGDRGTGKSSTVKAVLNEYYTQGLRMIEIPKAYLADLPQIIRVIKNRSLYFIFFIDDLAFEDNEESYTALKAVLEGGLESRPKNVVIYATSNRRHLIKEKFSDRSGITSVNRDDEVRASDTIQEKLSLADRFGITVTFSSPDKYKYLEIVEGLATQRDISMDRETLHKEALKWEMWYNGRSPRTARQFIDWLEGKMKD